MISSIAAPISTTHLKLATPTLGSESEELTVLYHATDALAAPKIKQMGFICGSSGMAGPGIYFSTSAKKARSRCRQLFSSVVLKCSIKLGNVLELHGTHTGDKSNCCRMKMQQAGCSSVKLTAMSKGTYCIYDSSQVDSVKIC